MSILTVSVVSNADFINGIPAMPYIGDQGKRETRNESNKKI